MAWVVLPLGKLKGRYIGRTKITSSSFIIYFIFFNLFNLQIQKYPRKNIIYVDDLIFMVIISVTWYTSSTSQWWLNHHLFFFKICSNVVTVLDGIRMYFLKYSLKIWVIREEKNLMIVANVSGNTENFFEKQNRFY